MSTTQAICMFLGTATLGFAVGLGFVRLLVYLDARDQRKSRERHEERLRQIRAANRASGGPG